MTVEFECDLYNRAAEKKRLYEDAFYGVVNQIREAFPDQVNIDAESITLCDRIVDLIEAVIALKGEVK